MNGVLIFSGTNIGTPVSTYTTNYVARQNDGSQAPTIGSYRDFRIWRKERALSEIQSTYRVSVLPNSDSLYYYLPLDEKLFITKNIPNNTMLTNYATSVGALMATSTIISQNNGTGAKYIADTNNQRLSGTYTDTLKAGEMLQVSYDSGITWKTVSYALNNNWYDALTSIFNGGLIKVRSVINGVLTNRIFADFIQYIKPTAPIIGNAVSNEGGKALVNFALPIKLGGGIINYKVISKPENITSSGLVSPIEVTGLTNDTSYTFKVVAINEAGVSDSSESSNIVVPVPTFTINTSVNNGSISTGPIIVKIRNNYRVTYKPNIGYVLDSIIVNNIYIGKDSVNGYTFTNVQGDSTIKLVFKVETFTIISSAGTGGTISPADTLVVNYGAKPSYTILPNTGFIIDTLFVNGVKVDSILSYTFDSVKSNQTISVKFKVQTFTIISSAGTGGGISPADTLVVNYGEKPIFSITPNIGFVIDTLFVN
ncbi:MAG: fibronectin type III domain-containing protein, partial [Sediminibacterium sp.]|nr:fibronectin type III domain-containing protein [Sediminibacterium sp.]